MIKLIKFCVVGSVNTLISLIMFYLFNKILGINYIISSVVSYTFGMLNSYLLNKRWTFNDKDNRVILQLLKFTIVNLVSLVLNLIAMYILVGKLHMDSMISQILATGLSTISNYIGSKVLVFRGTKNSEQLT